MKTLGIFSVNMFMANLILNKIPVTSRLVGELQYSYQSLKSICFLTAAHMYYILSSGIFFHWKKSDSQIF